MNWTLKATWLGILASALFCASPELVAQDVSLIPKLLGLGEPAKPKEPSVDYTPHPWRTWKAATGDRTFYGQFDQVVDDKNIKIFDAKGKELLVPIYRFSDQDIFEAFMCNTAGGGDDAYDIDEVSIEVAFDEITFTDESETKIPTPVEMPTFEEEVDLVELMLDENAASKAPMGKQSKPTEIQLKETQLKETQPKKVIPRNKPASAQQKADVKKAKSPKTSTPAQGPPLHEWNRLRTWTDASGKNSFKGTFQKIVDQSKVVVKTDQEKTVSFPLSRLSVSDIRVAVYGELVRDGGTRYPGVPISSDWVPGKNKN